MVYLAFRRNLPLEAESYPHLRATLFEFGLKGFPCHAFGAVVIERRQAAF